MANSRWPRRGREWILGIEGSDLEESKKRTTVHRAALGRRPGPLWTGSPRGVKIFDYVEHLRFQEGEANMKRLLTAVGVALLVAGLAPFALAEEEATKAAAENPVIVMKTNMGTIEVELYPDKAPTTVENFLRYVDEGHYDGTIFHRVIKGFMIQGGGFDTNMQQKSTHDPIKNEANNGLKNEPGTIAMARTSDPHSATAQFFINTVNNTFLNFTSESGRGWGYTVFGKVTSGMDVVTKIEATPTGAKRPFPKDVPQETVIIESVTLKK
jgi:peptidyl-prolyl cis-trans isomerase A (cyclophilin A)/peptidyl-prolyl cis-trans isomerase B (cyclophilin B)